MSRSRLRYFIILLVVLLLLTVPNYLSGRISLAVIKDGMQMLNQNPDLALTIQLAEYRGGIYESRLKLSIKSGHDAFQPFSIDAHLQHDFCGVQLQVGLVGPDGQSMIVAHRADEKSPRLGLKVGCYLSSLWSGPIPARFNSPALTVFVNQENIQLQETSINITLHDQKEDRQVKARLAEIKITSESIGQLMLSDMRLDIRTDKSADIRSMLKLDLGRVEFSGRSLLAHAEKIVSTVQFAQTMASVSTQWHLQAQESVVDGVPYIKITNLDMRSKLLSETVEGARSGTILKQTIYLDSNYGPMDIIVSSENEGVRIDAGKQTSSLFRNNPVQVQARMPHALMDVLYQTGMKHWLNTGVMIDEGAVVNWNGQFSF